MTARFLEAVARATTTTDINIAAGIMAERMRRRRRIERLILAPLAAWGMLDLLSVRVPGFFEWLPVDDHVQLFNRLGALASWLWGVLS